MAKIDQAALDALMKARTGLLIDAPFFGTLAMRLKMVEDGSIPTLNVDGKVIRYNPAFIKGQSNSLNKSAMAHEVMHCVLNHCGASGRGINLNPDKWGWAVDYVVNDQLKQAGFELGEGWLYDAQYTGMSAEQIYGKIPTPPPSSGKKPGAGNPGPIDSLSPGSPDPAVQAQQAVEWKVAATQAANAAKAVGKLHESLDAFVDQLKKNKVNWQEQLRQFITRASTNDYSYRRMNRKMQAVGYYLPGPFSEEMGVIGIAADESGSVDPAIVAAFGAEINAIKEDMRPEKIILKHFAVNVGKTEEFGPDDPFEMKRACTGGTDFRPFMREFDELPDPPLCVVVLTDLEGPFPDSPPDYPVLWVTINEHVAPFGETLHIEVD